MTKKLGILGSTGSIGKQALQVVREMGNIEVSLLAANSNAELLYEQAKEFRPKAICAADIQAYEILEEKLSGSGIKLFQGIDGIIDAIKESDADTVLNAIVGSAGLLPTVTAIEKGKNIALANKETLVSAGELIMDLVKKHNVKLFPVDSEHSAIFQCLQGNEMNPVKKILLTASGGPFRKLKKSELESVSLGDALNHPNWEMGAKITVDSATLMNKGLEVIEAKWLFGVELEDIEVVVHPESIIHSMVEFEDGAVMAQMGMPDMRLPIAYALTYPKRYDFNYEKLDLFKISALNFEKPRYEDFPCLNLAKKALLIGGTMPACMNAANEAAVCVFLKGELKFTQIPFIIEKTMNAYNYKKDYKLDDVLEADAFGRKFAYEVIRCL